MWKKGKELVIKASNEKKWFYALLLMFAVMIIASLRTTQDRTTDLLVGLAICLVIFFITRLLTKASELPSVILSERGFQYGNTLLDWDSIDYVYHFYRTTTTRTGSMTNKNKTPYLSVAYHDGKGVKKEIEINLDCYSNLFTTYYNPSDIRNAANYFSGREICNARK